MFEPESDKNRLHGNAGRRAFLVTSGAVLAAVALWLYKKPAPANAQPLPSGPPKQVTIVEFTDRRHYHNDENLKIGYNGFARLIFRGKCLTVDYVDLYGEIIFSEDWKVDGGNLRRTRADKHAEQR